MSDQYGRKCNLVLTSGTKGLDLSKFRIRFRITQADTEAPNTALIRVYNLAASTAQAIEKEYQRVVLHAGYESGNFGIIFQGTIKQIVRGRESAVDSFVDLYAADGDEAYNFAMVAKSLAAGASPQDQAKAITEAMSPYDVGLGDMQGLVGGTLPRGKVLFGMSRARMADICRTTGTTWSIQNGKLTVIPMTGYRPGEAVVLSARTGLIGIPEATIDGVECRCLLNPNVVIGTRVQINNADINTTTIREQGFPRYSDINLVASVSRDGFYRVLVSEFSGDTRGNDWYSELTCLAIDPSVAPDKSVQAYG